MAWYRSIGPWAVVVLGMHARPVSAQDASCPPADTADTIRSNLNIVSRCELTSVEVRGNVTLFSGGSLIARDVRVRGNLEGNRADFVDLDQSRIDGHVRLRELVGDLSTLTRTEVRRDVELTNNRSRLELTNNDLGGDLHVVGNTGGVLLAGNAIEDDLRCVGNDPAPAGMANRVDDETEGQCRNLQPEEPPQPPEPPPPPPPEPPPEPPPDPAPPEPPPPAPDPPGATPPAEPTDDSFVDDGGAGALGWPAALLLPLLAWRFRRRCRS